MRRLAILLTAALLFPAAAAAQTAPPPGAKDRVQYRPHIPDPVLTEMEKADGAAAEEAQASTDKIVAEQKAEQKRREESRKDLRVDLSGLKRPQGPGDFAVQGWHLPPVPQYLTSTCWSFSTTSYYESEIHRLTGREVKLSEMWTVYWEYVEKAREYIRTRGTSLFDEGSESEALPRMWGLYGVVPESAFPGVCAKDGRHDHDAMARQMKAYLEFCKANNYWDEAQILPALRAILDKTMGTPPKEVLWQGKSYAPKEFLREVCGLKMDDYVSFVSTSSKPFWTRVELEVEDNWWHGDRYLNIPLDDFYGAIVGAAKAGSTVAIGGDVSEPGYDGYNKVALVPSFDIPAGLIDQDAREYRIDNGTTTDDHGVHLVGWKQIDGTDWFLIKDSARAARKAEPQGYLFYRGDYVKLKMLSFTVHRDFVKGLLAKEAPEGPPAMTLPATSPALGGVALQTLEGKAVTLKALAGGKPTLLVFWATWCPDCRKQTPAVKSAFERFGPKGLNVVAVSTAGRDKVEMVKEYVAKNGLAYTVAYDADKAASKAYDIQWIPTFFLLDREGKVVYKAAEMSDAAVEALLAGKPQP